MGLKSEIIKQLQEQNNSIMYSNSDNEEIIKKHMLIKQLLEEKNCFLKMNTETAYSILRDLGINEEEIKNIYLKLVDLE